MHKESLSRMDTIITKDDNHVGDNDCVVRNDGDEDFEHWSSLLQGCLVHFWRPAKRQKVEIKICFHKFLTTWKRRKYPTQPF